jgi:hypothetical protein
VTANRISSVLEATRAWQVEYVKGDEVAPFPNSTAVPRRFLVGFRDHEAARHMLNNAWGGTIDKYPIWPSAPLPMDLGKGDLHRFKAEPTRYGRIGE